MGFERQRTLRINQANLKVTIITQSDNFVFKLKMSIYIDGGF